MAWRQPSCASRSIHSTAPGSGWSGPTATSRRNASSFASPSRLHPLGARAGQPRAEDRVVPLAEGVEELLVA